MNSLSLHVPSDTGSKKCPGTRKHRSGNRLSPLSLVSPEFLSDLLRSVGCAGSGLWSTGGRSEIYECFITSKRTRDTRDTGDKKHLERGFAVPSSRMVLGTKGCNQGQPPQNPPVEQSCFSVNDGLPHAISPPVALSPARSLLGGLIANSLVSCCSFASSLILGRQHHTDPFSLRRAMNHSHSVWFQRRIPLCFPLSEAFWNGNGCESKPFTFRTPMQDESRSKGGAPRGVGGLFRLPTQPCGTSTHTRHKNFYSFSMTRKTSP